MLVFVSVGALCAVTVTLCNTIYPALSKSMLSLAQPCSGKFPSSPLSSRLSNICGRYTILQALHLANTQLNVRRVKELRGEM